MNRPIPYGEPREWSGFGNTGLFYEKWGVALDDEWLLPSPEGKIAWVRGATGEFSGTRRCAAAKNIVTSLGGRWLKLTAVDAVAIGLGIASPVENGFLFDYATGAPYIPGSSLKGMMRTWAEVWEEADAALIAHLLGPPTDKAGEAGALIVFDAHPTKDRLQADVITPHHSAYHASDTLWPADWESPVPIPHLSIAAGAVFGFGLAVRPGQCEEDLDTAEAWLRCGLMHLGVGARTSRGYGRFE